MLFTRASLPATCWSRSGAYRKSQH